MELADGRRIAFEVSGAHAGAPVLLLRPLLGSIAAWGPFRAVLASRARVIAFDRSGSGDSSDAPYFLGTRGMAQEAVAVLDQLGVRRAHVFGASLGGMVATWLAIDAPHRVARVCLASTPDTGLDLSWPALAIAGCLAGPRDLAGTGLARRFLSSRLRAGPPGRPPRAEESAELERPRRREIAKHVAAAAMHDARWELDRVRAPVLVLAGERDEVIGTAPQRALAEAIPGARLEILRGAGHDLTAESPCAVGERVASFFLDEID